VMRTGYGGVWGVGEGGTVVGVGVVCKCGDMHS
jgi:hypothetical protein